MTTIDVNDIDNRESLRRTVCARYFYVRRVRKPNKRFTSRVGVLIGPWLGPRAALGRFTQHWSPVSNGSALCGQPRTSVPIQPRHLAAVLASGALHTTGPTPRGNGGASKGCGCGGEGL